jgi:cytochrome c
MKVVRLLVAMPFIFASGSPLSAESAGSGDKTNGKQPYDSSCVACHSVDDNRVGPAHRGVFGRKAGAVKGYDYSNAVKASKIVWSDKTLDRWLSNPELLIPGQKMGYSVTAAQDRLDLIAFLKSVSDKP